MALALACAGVAAHAAEPPALFPPLHALLGARQWLNTRPLLAGDLRGKVVLVNFWTYSCINSLRMLPYLRAWADKYGDRGLVVIGVHTPEFTFEKNLDNARAATVALGVDYPVALDSDYGIWRAFDNEAWPALYFIGADGRLRHHVLGEGGYRRSERLVQQLLSESSGVPVTDAIVAIHGTGAEAAADEEDEQSPETYVGYARARHFASLDSVRKDASAPYRKPAMLSHDRWSLAGSWTIGSEFATLDGSPGGIAFRFHARDLHLVLAPPADGTPARFRITLDGAAPGANHGSDVDAEGWGSVTEARLYQMVRQTGPIVDRTLEIQFLAPGVRAYVFTFG